MDAAAHRIVQESITNVLKHSASAEALVEVDYRPTEIRLRVCNPAAGVAVPVGAQVDPATGKADRSGDSESVPAGAGFGIAGMRERVELLGGTFSAAPTSTGGFEVAAVLPFPVPTAVPNR